MPIFGWDASHYDAPQVASAVADGVKFITHKAGGDATDQELDEWWGYAKGLDPAQVLLGAYWVLYPNNPVARADAFLARLDAVCVGWRNRPAFILQADCEKWNGNPDTVPSRAEIETFCDRLVERTGGKYRPIVYAPKWVYGDGLKGLSYPLWASSYVNGTAHYRSLYPGDSSTRWAAYSGQTPAILQYTSSATIGNQTTCDANAYRGTLAQLTTLVTPGSKQGVSALFCRYGETGDNVLYLQYRLKNLNPTISNLVGDADGGYGNQTAAGLAAAIRQHNGSTVDGKTYGPAQMIYIDVLWAKKYADTPGPAGPAGPAGPRGPAGAQGVAGPAGPAGQLVLPATFTFTGAIDQAL